MSSQPESSPRDARHEELDLFDAWNRRSRW